MKRLRKEEKERWRDVERTRERREEIWPLWVSAERGREGMAHSRREKRKGACEWLRVEEGCWYWLWWRWAGRAEEQGAGWIGRRASG